MTPRCKSAIETDCENVQALYDNLVNNAGRSADGLIAGVKPDTWYCEHGLIVALLDDNSAQGKTPFHMVDPKLVGIEYETKELPHTLGVASGSAAKEDSNESGSYAVGLSRVVNRKLGISEATFYAWRKRFGSLGTPEIRELRQLREENARLKRVVADLTLDRQILQDVVKKKW